MKLRNILLVVLAILVIIALWATISNGTEESSISLEPKEDVSIAVTGDVMFARKMPMF